MHQTKPSSAQAWTWLGTCGVVLGTLLLYSLAWFDALYGAGVGISVVGAERVLAGEVPYRDFWTMYAPGHFYLLALLFALFGQHIHVSIVAGSVLCALSAGLVHRLMLLLVGRQSYALVCASVFATAVYATNCHRNLGTYPPTVFFVLLSLYMIALYLQNARVGLLWGAGLATGVAASCKHDVGAYTAVAIGAGLCVHHIIQDGTLAQRIRASSGALWRFGTAATLVVLSVMVGFAWMAGWDLVQDLIVFPATDFPHSRGESYPSLLPIGLYDPWKLRWLFNINRYFYFALPFLIWVGGGIAAIGLMVRGRKSPPNTALGVTFAVAYLLHYLVAHVQINTHIISMSLYATCFGALTLHWLVCRLPAERTRWVHCLAVMVAIGWIGTLAMEYSRTLVLQRRTCTAALTSPKVSSIRVSPQNATALNGLYEFVQEHVPPGRAIYVGNHRHDIVIVSDTLMYFVLDRPGATRYQELHPGIADTATVQKEMINDLEQKAVSLIVLTDTFSDEALDRVKSAMRRNLPQIGAMELDHYIRTNFAPVKRFGRSTVWLRSTASGTIAQPTN